MVKRLAATLLIIPLLLVLQQNNVVVAETTVNAFDFAVDSSVSAGMAAVKRQAEMRQKFAKEVEALKGETHISEEELEELKKTTFYGEGPDIVERAHAESKKITVHEAVSKLSQDRLGSGEMDEILAFHKSGHMKSSFLEEAESHKQERDKNGLLMAAPTLGKGTPIQKAVRFLNAEYKEVYEKLDVLLFQCGMYKVEKEGLVEDINKDIADLASQCGSYVSAIQHSQMIIDQQNVLLAQLNEDLEAHLRSCAKQISIVQAQIDIVADDLKVVKTIIAAGEEACKKTFLLQEAGEADLTVKACAGADGKVEFVTENTVLSEALSQLKTKEAKEAAKRMLFEVMDISSDDPALSGLGELPEGLEYSAEAEVKDEDEADEGDDGPDAFTPPNAALVQISANAESEMALTPEDAMQLDGDEGGEEVTAEEQTQEHKHLEEDRKHRMSKKHHHHHQHKEVSHKHDEKTATKTTLGKKSSLAAVVKHTGQEEEQHHEKKLRAVPSKVQTRPGKKAQQSACPVGTKPNCAPLMEKLGRMAGEIKEALDALLDERAAIQAECNRVSANFRADIKNAEQMVSDFTAKMSEDTALLQNAMYQGVQKEGERHEVCSEMRIEYAKCHKELKALEEELCGIITIRYATHQKMVPAIKDPVFQDCIVSGWTPGECSKTCLDVNGIGGVEVFSREVTIAPNNIQTGGSMQVGAACPPMQFERACGEGFCPLDCELDVWAPWGKCTKECGGGSQARTRAVTQEPTEGGKPCEETQQGRQCNTQSCDVDCVLHDWTSWGPCTKSCRPYWWSQPGLHVRKRKIRIAIKGNGKCPRPSSRERYQNDRCNNFRCPRKLDCIAKQDLIVTVDGSGSLFYWSWRRSLWGRNFERSRRFVQAFVQGSTLDGYDAQDQNDAIDESKPELGTKYPKHMRIGVNLFSTRTKVVVPLTGDKSKLLTGVKGMKWPMGATYTHKALKQAMDMLKFSKQNRLKTILLLTDGRATDLRGAFIMARKVRRAGITIKVVPVGRNVPYWMVCRMASPPCNQNVELARRWRVLDYQMNRFIAGTCPMVKTR